MSLTNLMVLEARKYLLAPNKLGLNPRLLISSFTWTPGAVVLMCKMGHIPASPGYAGEN